MDQVIEQLKGLLNENAFNDILKQSKNRFYKIKSSIHVLENTDDVINEYLEQEYSLINVYGLFQYLFVSIDALYDLAFGILNNKWSININYNEKLRNIKYIRNDCIGHPTNRQYGKNDVGYCYIDFASTNKENLIYDVVLPEDHTSRKTIDIIDTINNFIVEYKNTIREIYGHFNKNKNDGAVFISPIAMNIFYSYNKGVYLKNEIKELRKIYIKSYNLEEESKNRFLWRLDIIENLFNIKTKNKKEADTLKYLILRQMDKTCLMAKDSDMHLYKHEAITLKFKAHESALIHYTKIYLKKSKYNYRGVLKDKNHPAFNYLLGKLLKNNNKMVRELAALIVSNVNNSLFLYALGTELERNNV